MSRRTLQLVMVLGASQLGAQRSKPASQFVVPPWAFPTAPAAAAPPSYDSVTLHHIAGSTLSMTTARAMNAFDAPDWFPAMHPEMPRPVRSGHAPEWRACGFCHLPNGNGRPENATLAGLPEAYIRAQIAAFRDKSRLAANPLGPTNSMHQIAAAAPDSDVAAAARYFSKLALVRPNRVVEVADVPKTRIEGILYALDRDGGTEPIGGRLIEVPEEFERHELHDPTVRYITYVPEGSIARGRHLATAGPAGPATVCTVCHGPALGGLGVIPPIAGRSPSYILRQLLNIRSGARHNTGSVPMQAVVKSLSVRDMVALAAYVGSRAP